LEITVTNENVTYDEIKSILNVWNACYHWVQDLSSSCLLCKNEEFTVCSLNHPDYEGSRLF
jgi:hypothetical protein